MYKIGFGTRSLRKSLTKEKLIQLEGELEIDTIVESGQQKIKKNKELKKYSYENLNELKSVLMLVASKSDGNNYDTSTNTSRDTLNESENLEYFIDLFDSVVHLTEILVKLVDSGCWLFDSILIKIQCDILNKYKDTSRSVLQIELNSNFANFNTLLNFGNSSSSSAPSIFSDETSIDSLKKLTRFMELSLQIWLNHIETIRNEFNLINLFTIKQIIYIKFYLNHNIFPLNHQNNNVIGQNGLSFEQFKNFVHNLNANVTDTTINEAYELSIKSHKQIKESKKRNAITKNSSKQEDFILKFANDNNFSKKVVRSAVKQIGITSTEDLFNYCLNNDDFADQDDAEIEDLSQSFDSMMDVETNVNESIDPHRILNERDVVEKMRLVFEKFIQDEMGLNNSYLTLEHLALILELLHDKNANNFERKIPGFLTYRGQPNLVMCSTRNQIEIVLSIYASSFDCPLPTNDEVLFCHSQTTNEQVENFIRIACKSNGRKIFTILNIQELSYENTIKIEKFLSTNTNVKHTNDYVLVFVCCADKQESQQSILASLLNKNRITPIVLRTKDLEQYLLSKFKNILNNSQGVLSHYDIEKSAIRCLVSREAGNGKSAYVDFLRKEIINTEYQFKLIRIKTSTLNMDNEIFKLLDYSSNQSVNSKTLFHIDIANEVFKNVDLYLFNMLIMGYLQHSNGLVWRRNLNDLFLIEIMSPYFRYELITLLKKN